MHASLSIAFWIVVPVVLAGATHVAVIRFGVLKRFALMPLDLGITFRGRRLFGPNKTMRGAVVMVLATAAWTVLQVKISFGLDWAKDLSPAFEGAHPFLWGALAGAGYVIGELPNSFVKRRLGIEAGDAARGGLKIAFWVIDQVDSVVGVLIFLYPVWRPSGQIIAALFAVTLLVHPMVALVMFCLGLKTRIG